MVPWWSSRSRPPATRSPARPRRGVRPSLAGRSRWAPPRSPAPRSTATATRGASFNVVVRDTTPPKIGTREDILESMPIDDRIDPKLYRVTMAVSFDPPPAWDVVDQNVSVTCDPPSGSQFPADLDPGETTTVTCTAIDDSGNRSGQSQFTVTIVAFPQPH